MTNDPARDAEIMRRYKSGDESQRAIARSMGIDRTIVKECLVRNNIGNLPRHSSWTSVDKLYLRIICNSLNNEGQPFTGKEFIQFFPNHTYSSIKYNRGLLRNEKLIR